MTITINEFHQESGALKKLHILSDDLCRRISEWNGSPKEKIRVWLDEGSRVYTTFSYFEREDLAKRKAVSDDTSQ